MQENNDFLGFIKSEKFAETAILFLFAALFVFLKLAQPWGYDVSHPFPAFYNANDNFVNGYAFPQSIKEDGNFAYEPFYAVDGYRDVVGYYPSLLLHLSAMFSILSGIETYDTTNIIATLFSIVPFILIYFVIRRYSRDLALLSLPFMLGIYNFDFEVERAFGQWIYITGAMFLSAVIWSADLLNRRYSFALIALFMTGAALGHTSEAIFAAGFLAFYLFIKYVKEKGIDKPMVKNLAIGFGAFLLISAYYLVIFQNTWVIGAQTYKFEVMSVSPISANYGVKISDLGIVLPVMFAGLLLGLKRLAFRKEDEIPFTAIVAGIFILFIGYTNYIGFGLRAWQTRHAWIIYLAVFSGIALYYAGTKLRKNMGFRHFAAISLMLILSFSYLHVNQLRGGGIIDQDGWNTLMWMKNNTGENETAAYFYGIVSSQPFSLWTTERVPYIVNFEDYVDGAKNGIIKSNYTVAPFTEDANAYFPYRKSFFEYGYHYKETNKQHATYGEMNYYVLPIAVQSAGNPSVAQYNLAIKDALLRQNNTREVYRNGEYSIIKRTK